MAGIELQHLLIEEFRLLEIPLALGEQASPYRRSASPAACVPPEARPASEAGAAAGCTPVSAIAGMGAFVTAGGGSGARTAKSRSADTIRSTAAAAKRRDLLFRKRSPSPDRRR